MTSPLRFFAKPELKNPSLIIGWNLDAGRLGHNITVYLNRKLEARGFCDIDPIGFFPLGGVAIEDDLIQFPESRFYACPKYDLIIFRSVPPSYEWHTFFSLILDVAQQYNVKELYTIGSMVSLGAHTTPTELVATFGSPELREVFSRYNLSSGLDYETPPGQRPTMNSFLLWTCKRRGIPGISLWATIPFYLVTLEDPKAQMKLLEFFDERFELQMDLSDLSEEVNRHNQILAEIRSSHPNLDESIKKLESNLMLSEEENQKLVKEIEELFKERG